MKGKKATVEKKTTNYSSIYFLDSDSLSISIKTFKNIQKKKDF